MSVEKVFNRKAGEWTSKKNLPWVRMRYELTSQIIREELGFVPQRILNIGCGDGSETILLDDLGAEHVLSDISSEMLKQARINLSTAGFTSPCFFICGSLDKVADELEGTFDLILLHNVLEYVDDPSAAIQKVGRLLSDNGVLSVRHLNRYTNFHAAAMWEHDLEKVERYIDSPVMHSSFDVDITTYTHEQIAHRLRSSGFARLQRYGVLILNNFIADNALRADPAFYGKQVELERKLAAHDPYFCMARFNLIIARR